MFPSPYGCRGWKAKEDRLRGQRDVSTLLKPQKRWLFLIKGVWAKVLLIWSIFCHSIGEAEGIDGLSDVIAHICSALRSHEIHAHACPRVISDTFYFRACPILFLLISRQVSKMLFYLESIEGSKSVLREELK